MASSAPSCAPVSGPLNVPRGRLYQSLCDAALGDARCGIDLADPLYRAEATVAAIRDRYRLEIAGVSGFEAGWFGFGTAQWSSWPARRHHATRS